MKFTVLVLSPDANKFDERVARRYAWRWPLLWLTLALNCTQTLPMAMGVIPPWVPLVALVGSMTLWLLFWRYTKHEVERLLLTPRRAVHALAGGIVHHAQAPLKTLLHSIRNNTTYSYLCQHSWELTRRLAADELRLKPNDAVGRAKIWVELAAFTSVEMSAHLTV